MNKEPMEGLNRKQHIECPATSIRDLHLEMGQQCNVRCSMCYQTDFSPQTKMPEIVWREKLLPAYKSARTLTLQGGEPTILKNCRELLELVLGSFPNVRLNTVTNGVLFRGIWEDSFLAQGAYLNFSLNAIDRSLYERIVQFGKQEEVIKNIDRLVRRKRELRSNLIIRVSSVILSETIEELARFITWAADHGLDQVLFHTDTVLSLKRSDSATVQKHIADAYAVADRFPELKLLHLDEFDWLYSTRHGLMPVRERVKTIPAQETCPVAFENLFVDFRGVARPCCRSWIPVGDFKLDTLEDVWNSKQATRFRKRLLNRDYRDCPVTCDLNPYPISPRWSDVRRAYWLFRREPTNAARKMARKFGLNSAQLNLPVLRPDEAKD